LMPGAFLEFIQLPPAWFDSPAGDYGVVAVSTTPAARVAVEQFDASSRRPLAGFGAGWHEQEFNPRLGLRWRWLSERGELHVVATPSSPADAKPAIASLPLTLHVEGEAPLKYFSRASRLVVRTGGQTVFDGQLADDFRLDIPIPNANGTIVLETDQTFAPAERSSRTGDRRRLGLRILKCEVRGGQP
jgi:hypothetical protein